MDFLEKLDFTKEEINKLNETLSKNILESVITFPGIVSANYNILKDIGINNYKEIFLNHTHMFLQNPDRFQKIFDKYDHADLIRCLEKNGNIIEKL